MNRKKSFWIGLGSLLAVAAAALVIKKNKKPSHERPPKGAPQLHIENPGSQDEFPKPPLESEIG